MKHVLVLLFPFVCCISAHGQFRSMMDKLKNKAVSKLTSSKDSTAAARPVDTVPAVSSGSGASSGPGTGGPAGGAASGGHAEPQPPQFPVTGNMVRATRIDFGVDADEDWANLLKNPAVQDFISRVRQRGVTGTDKEVLFTAMQHSEEYDDILGDLRAKYGTSAAAAFKPMPSLVFSALLMEYDYVISSDHIRAELGKAGETASQQGLAGAFVNALAPGAVTLVDLNVNKSYAIANYLGILSAAVVDDISNYRDAMGLTAYFKKYMHQQNIKLEPLGHKELHGYNASVFRMEIPVTPTTDDNGKQNDGLLFLHSLLSGHSEDIGTKHYDPTYKLYLETYYSHDLDADIPLKVLTDKNPVSEAGFYVGSILKDEKGNQVIFDIKKIEANLQIDAGQFMIPTGYEIMTHAEFHEKIRAKLRGGH
jgi:hypothetical protein